MNKSTLALHFQRTHGYRLAEHVPRVTEEERCARLGVAWPGNDYQDEYDPHFERSGKRWWHVPQRYFGDENPHELTPSLWREKVKAPRLVLFGPPTLPASPAPAPPRPRELDNHGIRTEPVIVVSEPVRHRNLPALLALASILGGPSLVMRRPRW